MRAFLLAGPFVLLLTAGAGAQPKPPDAADLPALRYELGRRLKRFEAAWEKCGEAEAKSRALKHVEKLTQRFFSLQFGAAARSLDLAAFALTSDAEPAASRQWAWSLYAVPESRLVDGKAKELTVTVKQLYPVKGDPPKGLEVQLWFTDKQVTKLNPKRFPHAVKVPLPPLGDFKGLDRKLYFMVEAGRELRYSAVGVSQVAELLPRLVALKKAVAGFEAIDTIEKATARDRGELLQGLWGGAVPETDLPAAGLLANAEEMLAGKPFFTAAKPGQFWLSVPTGEKKSTPVRLFVPRKLGEAGSVPVVVALHGAGGSENLFFEGYGAGRIVAECRKRGWLLVSPRGGLAFGSAPPAPPVPAILDRLAERYPIDRKRVFVVGHSMGAAQAIELVQKRPGSFAAAAALGGGGVVREPKVFAELPLFVGVGQKDTLALGSARSLKKSLTDAGEKRLTYEEYPGVEHLVIVREALPDVFALFDKVASGK
jgi:predicted esterase